jgi:hypothetical protein
MSCHPYRYRGSATEVTATATIDRLVHHAEILSTIGTQP